MKAARGGATSSGISNYQARRVTGLSITDPPCLKPGQVRCHACRNATRLTPSGHYRKHLDLFGLDCPTKCPKGASFALAELPPVEHRGEVVTSALDPERVRLSKKGAGNGVRLYGDCIDCGSFVSGERKYCGVCAMRRQERRRDSPGIAS